MVVAEAPLNGNRVFLTKMQHLQLSDVTHERNLSAA